VGATIVPEAKQGLRSFTVDLGEQDEMRSRGCDEETTGVLMEVALNIDRSGTSRVNPVVPDLADHGGVSFKVIDAPDSFPTQLKD
jgi:hypothetical protein